MKKKVLIAVGILFFIYAIFVTVDCIRLGDLPNGSPNKQPLITISMREYEDDLGYGTEYIGLGYSIKYYKPNNSMGYKARVNLFGIIQVTGYEVQ